MRGSAQTEDAAGPSAVRAACGRDDTLTSKGAENLFSHIDTDASHCPSTLLQRWVGREQRVSSGRASRSAHGGPDARGCASDAPSSDWCVGATAACFFWGNGCGTRSLRLAKTRTVKHAGRAVNQDFGRSDRPRDGLRCAPPRSPTPAPVLPHSLRVFLALMMCPVSSRNGKNSRAAEQSRRRGLFDALLAF